MLGRGMARVAAAGVAGATLAAWLSGTPLAADGPAAATVRGADADVLARFVAHPDEPTRAFRARRRLEITSGALGKKAWVEVRVELDPGQGFRYTVLGAGGSEMLQQKILLRVLCAEQEVYASGGSWKTALTSDNYAFAPGGRGPHGLVRLLATARRKEVGLLNGEFLVTPDTADLMEVSGTMAKAPSFWISRVELRKRYARLGGHRVNVEVQSVSHLRLFGVSRFSMTTQYEEIDGDAVRQ